MSTLAPKICPHCDREYQDQFEASDGFRTYFHLRTWEKCVIPNGGEGTTIKIGKPDERKGI